MADTERKAATSSLLEALSEPTVDRAKALGSVMKAWEENIRPMYPKWMQQLKFRDGEQWGRFDEKAFAWQRESFARKEVRETRLTIPVIQSLLLQLRSLMTRERPMFDVVASNGTVVDVSASKSASTLSRWLWNQLFMADVYADCVEFAAAVGTWTLEPVWDKSLGCHVEQEILDGEQNDDGSWKKEPALVKKVLPAGALRLNMWSPFETLVAPGATWLNEGPAITFLHEMSLWDINETYGSKATEGVTPDANDDSSGADYARRLANSLRGDAAMSEGGVRVFRTYIAQCGRFPRGKLLQYTATKILDQRDNPICATEDEEKNGATKKQLRWPAVTFRHVTQPKKWHGKGVVEDLTELQMGVNGAESKEMVILRLHAHPRPMVPQGSKVEFDADPNSTIEYPKRDGPDAYKYMQPPQHGQELSGKALRLLSYMDRIAGLNASTQGISTPGDSGRKTQLLQQQDLGRLGDIKGRHDRGMAAAMGVALLYCSRYMTVEEKVLVCGENQRSSVETLSGENLGTSIDVFLANDNSLPQDPTARQIALTNIAMSVSQMPPEERQQWYELHGLRDFKKIEESKFRDRDLAMDENVEILKGGNPIVTHWQDDLVHLAEHHDFANSPEFINACKKEVQPAASPGDTAAPGVAAPAADYRESATFKRFVVHEAWHNIQLKAKKDPTSLTPDERAVLGMPEPQPPAAAVPGAPAGPASGPATPTGAPPPVSAPAPVHPQPPVGAPRPALA